ncbi:Do family serine endopeptidase [Dokdonella sp.]|uniref:Do family serine endopeptidase n=1 Tax=Dokdonella sp. TaxID=2291710 RepID=UPI002C0C5C20|nr:Do family serine endopeptidase [Dokdonella sp.]HPN78384.1 Do family serine endopeptidase [Dokdonella sp.]
MPWNPTFRSFLIALGFSIAGLFTALSVQAGLPPAVDGQPLPSLAPMIDRVTPAVVNINTRTRVQVRDPFFDDPVFRRFFNMPNQPRERVQQSLGSGVIVDAAKGYVLTNNHVTQGADDIEVTLHDNRTVKARVIGSDPDTDLTVLQIPAENLQALTLAASKNLRVGDFVVAVGDPFGLGQTVTSGIVSALDRTGLSRGGYQNFIQTDASINPGNSGGALVNLRGELVGINSMIFSPSGASVGIGFAIPSDLAANVMRQLVENGEVRRGALGVETQDVTPELASMLSIGAGKGTVVTRVRSGTPAAEAGLKPGDVITSVNGKAIGSGQDLHNIEGLTPIGTNLTVGLLRDGKALSLPMILKVSASTNRRGLDLDARLTGVQLADLSDSQRRPGVSGSAVKDIDRNSRAYASGLRTGDVIVGINQRDIEDTSDLAELLQRTPRQLLLTVVRGQSVFYLLLQ